MPAVDNNPRRLPRWLGSSMAAILAVLALAASAQAQGTGILEGQAVNGTADGPAVGAGLPVTLHVLQGDLEMGTLEAVTDADGRFRFEGLDTDAGLDYWPEVIYLDVPYSPAEPYRFGGGVTTLQATVEVYETTDDDRSVSLDSIHVIAESFGDVLRISEIHLFGNSEDRTYIGSDGDADPRTTVYIPLPEAAVGLALEQGTVGDRFVEADGGLLDTEPVLPGQETSLAFFSYHLVVSGGAIRLERRFAYPVVDLNFLVAQPGLTLSSDQLQPRGTESFQGQQYEFYMAQNLDPDVPLVVELVPVADTSGGASMPGAPGGDPQGETSAPTRGNQEMLRWIGLALVGLAVIGVAIYALAFRRPTVVPPPSPDLASNPEARRLLAQLADLAQRRETGQIDEATYGRQQAELSEKIKSLYR